jgi:predicted alpha/beta hydrolase
MPWRGSSRNTRSDLRSAPIERRLTTPAQAGVRRIGHHGFFAERHRATLWSAALDWIDVRCA